MSTNTLMSLEQGRSRDPGFFRVASICHVLGVGLDDLARRVTPKATKGPRMTHGIVSVGYEGRSIDQFVTDLSSYGVGTVADVRMNPISRKPGFSKKRLIAALEGAGIGYIHLKSLGNPKTNREPFWSGRIEEGQDVFRRQLESPDAERDLAELGRRANREVVAVLCFEASSSNCHRQVVIDEVTSAHAVPVVALEGSA